MESNFYISTDMVDASIRDDFWRETSSLLYEVTPVDGKGGAGMSGSVRSRLFGSLVLGNTTFNAQDCRRTPSLIAQTDLDFYLLQVILAGEYRGNFAGRDLYAKPGDMFILDLTRPLDSRKEAGARISVVIPRKDIGKQLAMKNLHGLVLSSKAAINRLLFDFIVSLDGLLDNMEAHAIPDVQESLMTLVNAALSGATLTHAQYMSINLSMRQHVIAFIDQHLSNPELGPRMIMQHFRLSHSHLYRAFEPDKGIAKLIRNKRLDMACRMILQQREQSLSLKEIAYKCGFPGRTQFSRFFQDRFGIAPKELRHLQDAIPRGINSSILFHHYVAERIPQHR